jgi:hypothetical protein
MVNTMTSEEARRKLLTLREESRGGEESTVDAFSDSPRITSQGGIRINGI